MEEEDYFFSKFQRNLVNYQNLKLYLIFHQAHDAPKYKKRAKKRPKKEQKKEQRYLKTKGQKKDVSIVDTYTRSSSYILPMSSCKF